MKIMSIIMMAIIGTLILNLPMQSYADPQLDTLLRIATEARDNLSINLSQLTNIPSDISNLYKKGSDETDALNQAVQQQDIGSAKQHFLSAMQFFKATNDKINSLNATGLNDQQGTQILTLQDQINSLQNTGKRLKDIAATNNVDANFTEFDQLIQQARQDLSNNNINATATDIQSLDQTISNIHHYLATIAQQRTSDRAKDFTEKQIERLGTESTNITSNTTSQQPVNAASTLNANATSEESPQEMVAKLRTLISQGKIDEAIQELKTLQESQKRKLESSSNESSTQQDNFPPEINQNTNPPIPNSIPNNEDNSTTSENQTGHGHQPIPNSIPNNQNNPAGISSKNEDNSKKINPDKLKGSENQAKTGQNPPNSPKDNSQNTQDNHGKNKEEKRNNKRIIHDYFED